MAPTLRDTTNIYYDAICRPEQVQVNMYQDEESEGKMTEDPLIVGLFPSIVERVCLLNVSVC